MEDPRVFSDRNCECVVSGTDSPDTLHSVFADRLRSPLCYPVQQHDERRGNGEDQETEGVTLGNIHESERLSGFPSSGTSVQDTHHEKCGRTQFSTKINTMSTLLTCLSGACRLKQDWVGPMSGVGNVIWASERPRRGRKLRQHLTLRDGAKALTSSVQYLINPENYVFVSIALAQIFRKGASRSER